MRQNFRHDPFLTTLVGNPFTPTRVGECGPTGTGMLPWPPGTAEVAAMQSAQQARAARAAIAVQQPQITLGLNSEGLLAPGSTTVLTATPSVPLCITDYDVARANSAFFLIHSMKTARVEFLADGQPIPAEIFSPDGIHPPLEWPYLMPGTLVSVTVENIDAASHRYFSAFWGIPSGQYGPCL